MPSFDLSRLTPGQSGSSSLTVEPHQSARALGSGSLEVFATPMLVALMERAAVACLEPHLPAGVTSLGIEISLTHEAPTALGGTVRATAELTEIKDRLLTFRIEAHDGAGLIGKGTHRRAVVEAARFLEKLGLRRL